MPEPAQTTDSLVAPSAKLIDAATGTELGCDQLAVALSDVAAEYAQLPAGVVFARTGVSLDSALRHLGAFTAGRAIAPLDPGLPAETINDFVRRYEPAALVGLAEGDDLGEVAKGYRLAELPRLGPVWVREEPSAWQPHPDLALLLTTSGSTGDPKLVRLSRRGVVDNARAIAAALHITESEIAPTSLPLYYSFGLSVLHSHMVAGATVVIVDGGVLAREFWGAVSTHGATSLAGVAHTYQMLARIRWRPEKYPTLRTLTQAGGKLADDLIERFATAIAEVGGAMYVMWGQTEAGPRMSTLPARWVFDKLGSVGPALPGGRLSIRTESGEETTDADISGEVVYRGSNVMMGYAVTAADLAEPDTVGGVLATGDLGRLDSDGCLWLTGRMRRFAKIFGIRVNLVDIEALAVEATDQGDVAAVPIGDRVAVFVAGLSNDDTAGLTRRLADELRLHPSGFVVRGIADLPRRPNGKIDYPALEALA